MTRSVKIIANPVAGAGKSRQQVSRLMDALAARGMDVDVFFTRHAGDGAREAERMDGRRYECVVVCGGDGTVREVLNGMIRTEEEAPWEAPVAILPAGTANVLAKEWGLPRTPDGVAEIIDQGHRARMDLCRAGDEYFTFVSGVGFDGRIVHDVTRARRGGALSGMHAYVPPLLRELTRRDVPVLRVEVDGETVAAAANFVVVSNAANYGGPFQITSLAHPQSGFLDVAVFRRPIRLNFIKYALMALFRVLPSSTEVDFHRGREVRVAGAKGQAVPYQADGDMGGETPVSYAILPERVSLIVPEHRTT